MDQPIFKSMVNQDEKSKKELELKIQNGHARPMGHVENLFGIYQREKIYKSFSIICKYNKVINDEALLFHALRPILVKYPLLSAAIVDQKIEDSVKPRPHDYIKVVDKVQLSDVMYELDKEIKTLKDCELLEALNNIVLPYGDDQLTWRLAIIDDFTLAYISNHVLADGITGKNLFQDLQIQLSKLYGSEIPSISPNSLLFNYSTDSTMLNHLPDPSDSVIDYAPPYSFIPECLFNRFIIGRFCPNSHASPGVSINYQTIHISASELSKIKQDLIDHEEDKKITLTPYIQAAWLNALYKTQVYNSKVTNFLLAVDARQYFPQENIDQYKYGLNTSATNKYFHNIKDFTWSWVGYLNDYIKWCVNTKRPLFLLGFLTLDKIVGNKNLDVEVRKTQHDKIRTNTLFSNLGVVESNRKEVVDIEDCIFTQHFNGSFYDFSINAITTRKGGLNFVISSPGNASFSKAKFNEAVLAFKENLIGECCK